MRKIIIKNKQVQTTDKHLFYFLLYNVLLCSFTIAAARITRHFSTFVACLPVTSQDSPFYPVPDTSGILFRSISLFACIFVSLLARLRENGWTDLHEFSMGRPGYINSQKPRDASMHNTGTGSVVLSHHSLFTTCISYTSPLYHVQCLSSDNCHFGRFNF